jgi:hypothetical protein
MLYILPWAVNCVARCSSLAPRGHPQTARTMGTTRSLTGADRPSSRFYSAHACDRGVAYQSRAADLPDEEAKKILGGLYASTPFGPRRAVPVAPEVEDPRSWSGPVIDLDDLPSGLETLAQLAASSLDELCAHIRKLVGPAPLPTQKQASWHPGLPHAHRRSRSAGRTLAGWTPVASANSRKLSRFPEPIAGRGKVSTPARCFAGTCAGAWTIACIHLIPSGGSRCASPVGNGGPRRARNRTRRRRRISPRRTRVERGRCRARARR